jgi:hypothetical protein
VKKAANRRTRSKFARAIVKFDPNDPGLDREEWDFSTCPDEQLEACYFYEFAKECPHAIRVSRVAHESLKEITAAYGPKASYSLAAGVIDLFKDCPEFPGTPFLCIPKLEREQRIANLCKANPLVQADLPSLIRQHANKPLRRKAIGKTLKYLAGQGDIAAFYIDWRMTNEQLIQGFRQWLRTNRPLTAVPIVRKGKGSSREQIRKDLKALGAWRLLKKMRWEDAYNHTREILKNKRGLPQPLFDSHASAWGRARKDAGKAIADVCSVLQRLT